MLTMIHNGAVNVDPKTLTMNETYVVELSYVVTSDDVNKREAFMNQLQNLVKQYAPKESSLNLFAEGV